MDFMEAVKEMKKGKKVRRKDIKDYRYLLNGVISLEEEPSMGCTGDDAVTLEEFESVDWEVVKPINPAHFCMNCDKHLGFRGFCSKKCHDVWYDKEYGEIEDKKSLSDKKVARGLGMGNFYEEHDAKEFIKTIKQKIYGLTSNSPEILAMIDKEAGKQLTQH